MLCFAIKKCGGKALAALRHILGLFVDTGLLCDDFACELAPRCGRGGCITCAGGCHLGLPHLAVLCGSVDAWAVNSEQVNATVNEVIAGWRGFLLPDGVGGGSCVGGVALAVYPDVACALECEAVPDYDALASCLFALYAVVKLVLLRIHVVDEAVLTDECAGVGEAQSVEGRFTLQFHVAEYGVDACDFPTNLVGLDGNLHLRVLAEVDALQLFEKILARKQEGGLGHIFAGEIHLGQGDEFLKGPLAGVLKLALELPTDALGEVNHLLAELGDLDGEFTLLADPQGAVAGSLEVEDGLFCDEALSEGDVLLLRLEVVGNDLVHAALLEIDDRGTRNDEVGVNLLLRLVHGVGKEFHLAAGGDGGGGAECVSGVGLRAVHCANDGIVGCRVTSCDKEHEALSGGDGLAIGRVAVHIGNEKCVIVAGNVLVACYERKDKLNLRACGNGGVRGEGRALLVNHEVFYLGAVDLYFLRFEHKRHEGGVLALKAKNLLVNVGLYEVARCDAACCARYIADGRGVARCLAVNSGGAGRSGNRIACTYNYGFSCCFCHGL